MKLERPDVKFKTSFIAAVQEFRANGSGLEDLRELELVNLENDFEAYIQSRFRWENLATLEPGKVLQSEFWLVDNLEYIGRAKLRHELNDHLRVFGGHIGYEIRPTRQRQGLGTLMLKLVLEKAHELGLERVLITCDEDNLGSRGVIEENGGELEGEFQLDWYDKPIRRYWINLEP
jgi:predicted acetyltransferase